jgi:hypothetical protein
MAKSLAQIEEKIAGIKQKLMELGEMRPGSLTHQYHKPKEKKGGFYQISYTHKMRSKTEYVRPEFVKDLRDQIASFKNFKRLVQQWTDLAIEYSRLKIAAAKKVGKGST